MEKKKVSSKEKRTGGGNRGTQVRLVREHSREKIDGARVACQSSEALALDKKSW